MLERTAATVMSSTEALAVEEARARSFILQISKFLKFMNEIDIPDDIIEQCLWPLINGLRLTEKAMTHFTFVGRVL